MIKSYDILAMFLGYIRQKLANGLESIYILSWNGDSLIKAIEVLVGSLL